MIGIMCEVYDRKSCGPFGFSIGMPKWISTLFHSQIKIDLLFFFLQFELIGLCLKQCL